MFLGRFWVKPIVILVTMFYFGRFWVKPIVILVTMFYFGRFWAKPIVILVAMFAIPQWMREKTVHGVELFCIICAHLFFLVRLMLKIFNYVAILTFPVHSSVMCSL